MDRETFRQYEISVQSANEIGLSTRRAVPRIGYSGEGSKHLCCIYRVAHKNKRNIGLHVFCRTVLRSVLMPLLFSFCVCNMGRYEVFNDNV